MRATFVARFLSCRTRRTTTTDLPHYHQMDVTVNAHEDLSSYFSLLSEEFAWPKERQTEVLRRREAMDNLLFFDLLLELGGVENSQVLYPPKDMKGLERLLDAIQKVKYDTMKRDCLIYYLLKWQVDSREAQFADEKCIAPHYVSLADAYWHLDSGLNLGKAVALLADARIVKDYPSKIISTLALSPDAAHLIRKFVRTSRPALTELPDLERYLIALAEESIVDAWNYQRSFNESSPVRRPLIHTLLEWSLTPTPKRKALIPLLSLPFSRFEEQVIQEYAKQPPSEVPQSSIAILRDMVCVRLIQSCKYIEALKFDRQFSPANGQSNFKGTWGFERNHIMKEVLSIMPAAERQLLEEELGGLPQRDRSSRTSKTSPPSLKSWGSIPTELSMSWEDLGRSGLASAPSTGASAPRRNLAARSPRTSITNEGLPRQSLGTPGTKRPSDSRVAPLSAQSTVISQSSLTQATVLGQLLPEPQIIPTRTSLPPPIAPSKIISNGTANTQNGTPKTSGFMTRNAFFEPPNASPPHHPSNVNGLSHNSPSTSVSQKQPQLPPVRLPTPPRENIIVPPSDPTPPKEKPQHPGRENGRNIRVVDESESDREELQHSIFGLPPKVVSPPSPRSPKRTRKGREPSVQKLIPGAFVDDEDHTGQPTHVTRSVSHRANLPESGPTENPVSSGPKRSSRKRAASPDGSPISAKISIPGGLGDESEPDGNSEYGDEEGDFLAPLPKTRSRQSAPNRPSTKARSGRSSRASSSEPEDPQEGRTVRRSSRLSTTSSISQPTSPVEKSRRPRKSTRTAGAGATATGRGATKRR